MVWKSFLRASCLALRHFPWEAGRWRFLPWALHACQKTFISEEHRIIRSRHGFKLNVDLSDWLGRHFYVTGEYEPATTRVVKALLKPGDRVIDIGANLGYFTMLAAHLVGPKGHVMAFEPVPVVRQLLENNIRLNAFGNCEVRKEALSNCSPGMVTLHEGPRDHRGVSSMRALEDAALHHQVPVGRFDELIQDKQKVSLVKIDVEGAELLALQGMRNCLECDRPDLIVEITDSFLRSMGHSAIMLCQYLHQLGYAMYRIEHKFLSKVRDPENQDFEGQFNALFTSRSKLPPKLTVQDSKEHAGKAVQAAAVS
jgi:FkbM family methyltransferase